MADNKNNKSKNKFKNPLSIGGNSSGDSGKIKIISETEEKVDQSETIPATEGSFSDDIPTNNTPDNKQIDQSTNSNTSYDSDKPVQPNETNINTDSQNEKVKFSNKPIVVKDTSIPPAQNENINTDIKDTPTPKSDNNNDPKINNNEVDDSFKDKSNSIENINTQNDIKKPQEKIQDSSISNVDLKPDSQDSSSQPIQATPNDAPNAPSASSIPKPNQKPAPNPLHAKPNNMNTQNNGFINMQDKEVSQYISNRKLVGGVGDIYEQEQQQTKKNKNNKFWSNKGKKEKKQKNISIPPGTVNTNNAQFEAPKTSAGKKVKIGGPNKASWLIFGGLVFLIIAMSWWYISGGKETVKTVSENYLSFLPFVGEDEPPKPDLCDDGTEPPCEPVKPNLCDDGTEPPCEEPEPENIIIVEDNILNDETILNIDKFRTRSSDSINDAITDFEINAIAEELKQANN